MTKQTLRCPNSGLILKAYWGIRKSAMGMKGTEALGGKRSKHVREKITFKRHNILKTWPMSLGMCYRSLNPRSEPLTHYTGTFPQSSQSLAPREGKQVPFPHHRHPQGHWFWFQPRVSLLGAELRHPWKLAFMLTHVHHEWKMESRKKWRAFGWNNIWKNILESQMSA